MCDRSQEEILAREMTHEVYRSWGMRGDALTGFTESFWKTRLVMAKRIIDALEQHQRS